MANRLFALNNSKYEIYGKNTYPYEHRYMFDKARSNKHTSLTFTDK